MLQLRPWEFWRCTPRELHLMLDAAGARDDRSWRQVAQLAAWLLQPWSRKRVKADKLIGPRRSHRSAGHPPSYWNRSESDHD